MSSQRSLDCRSSDGCQVLEEESYQRAVAQCGSYEYLDDTLAPVDFALHRNPLGFAEVPSFPGIHLAKTKLRFAGLEIVPSFRMWLRVDVAARRVHKVCVEIAPPDDMGFARDPWDENEIPF